jgi:hypothetical protein
LMARDVLPTLKSLGDDEDEEGQNAE